MPTPPRLLGRGVGPPRCCPLSWTWVALLGRSCAVAAGHSRLLPLTSDVGYLLLAAALRAWGPPGFCPWSWTWGSSSRPWLVRRLQPAPNVVNGHCMLTIVITLQYLSHHIFFQHYLNLNLKSIHSVTGTHLNISIWFNLCIAFIIWLLLSSNLRLGIDASERRITRSKSQS